MRLMTSSTESMEVQERARDISIQILRELIGSFCPRQFRVRFWDDSQWPEESDARTTLVLKHPGALREMLSIASEDRMAEAYLRDDCDIEGNVEDVFELVDAIVKKTLGWTKSLKLGHLLRQLPDSRARIWGFTERLASLKGRRHSLTRDQEAIQFHYDLSNDFYKLWLDRQMVYSCAYFQHEDDSLEQGQIQKLDYICRKLGLRQGQRILDIGCGWGGLLLHAVRNYGVRAVGITLSRNQAAYIEEIVKRENLRNRIEVRLQDYREVDEPDTYDAVVSVGMVEHVGRDNLTTYFQNANRLLKPGGVFLNHGIGTGSVPMLNGVGSFIQKYVFPDTDLFSIAEMLKPVEGTGFEIRDVENFREHYMLTLRHWIRNLEEHHEECLDHVSEYVYRIWRLYMAGCAHGFDCGQLAIYQTLLSKPDERGHAYRPLTRSAWYQ